MSDAIKSAVRADLQKIAALLGAALASVLTPPPLIAASPVYQIKDLGTLGGPESSAFGINDDGAVVGVSAMPNSAPTRGFLYRGCPLKELTLGGIVNGGSANAVSNNGKVVGSDNTIEDYYVYPYLYDYKSRSMTNLGSDGIGTMNCGSSAFGMGVNSQGTIVGWRNFGSTNYEAFVWRGQLMGSLGTLGGRQSFAYDIDDQERIVGSAETATGAAHAFLYQNGGMSDLGTLGGGQSQATRLNRDGLIIGWAEDANGHHHAAAWNGGQVADLGHLGGNRSEALGLNDAGDVVGWSETGFGAVRHAAIFENGTAKDLNERLPAGSGWVLTDANDINNLGQIVGQGINPQGLKHAYLLSPIPFQACQEEAIVNVKPIAVAGVNQSIDLGATVSLYGAASYDPDRQPQALRYRWQVTDAPAEIALTAPTSIAPSFKPLKAGLYVVSLIVNDGETDSLPSRVSIQVNAPAASNPPVSPPPSSSTPTTPVSTPIIQTPSQPAAEKPSGDGSDAQRVCQSKACLKTMKAKMKKLSSMSTALKSAQLAYNRAASKLASAKPGNLAKLSRTASTAAKKLNSAQVAVDALKAEITALSD